MKKLLFTLLLAAVTLPGWAEELYLVGSAVSIDWNINNAMRATKMTETSTSVFEWTGYFKASGEFKILTNKDSWDNGYNPTSATVTLSDQNSGIQDRSGGDNKWKVASDGVYKITVNTSDKTIKAESATMSIPTLTDGYYQIGTANDLKNFADAINKGAIAPSVNAKLTANIDMTSITDFTPICCANAIKFTGEFDGQGYAITNLKVDYGSSFGYTGLFCYATNGAVIKNLIVGTGCSFKGTAKIGGIIGSAEGGGTVTLTNVINMANVTSTGSSDANAAGLVGCGSGGTKIVATNCANTGEIHGQDGQCAAFAGWTQSGTTFTNCYNIGNIYNMQDNQSLYRNPGDVNATNCYDANGADFYTQGTKIARTTVASGELCYKLNGDQTSINWYQTIGTATYPVPFNTNKQVYQAGTSYTNLTVVDGKVQISDADDLVTFSAEVNVGNTALNAKLTNDIDMTDVNNYTPIGTADNLYSGTFDGGTHRIKNLVISNNIKEQGLFSVCTGATIKNLIMDSSCSIKSTNSAWGNAAFVAVCNGSGTLTFENCGNEASVEGASGNNAAFLGKNYSSGTGLKTVLTNCYNTGTIKGGGYNAAFVGESNGKEVTTTNCYNKGTVERNDGGNATWINGNGTKNITNCYTTLSSGELTGLTTSYSEDKITSGELCYLLNGSSCYDAKWFQNLTGDSYPVPFNTHGIVNKISSAGYTTQYIPSTDVTIPTGVKAYAGVISGDNLSLKEITSAISKEDAVVLEGTANAYYSFVPTTGASEYTGNALSGSDGTVTGGDGIYALSTLGGTAPVGFYPLTDTNIKIPAGKAYLNLSGSTVKGFTFVFDDDATAIEETLSNSPLKGENIYNVAGQRIQKMQKGINIVNGKKVMVK